MRGGRMIRVLVVDDEALIRTRFQHILNPAGDIEVVDGYLAGRTHSGGLVERLSAREREILVLLADGLSNGEIASRLYLGVGTVKDHVSAILTKLEVSGRVQAALVAERAGLLRGRA